MLNAVRGIERARCVGLVALSCLCGVFAEENPAVALFSANIADVRSIKSCRISSTTTIAGSDKAERNYRKSYIQSGGVVKLTFAPSAPPGLDRKFPDSLYTGDVDYQIVYGNGRFEFYNGLTGDLLLSSDGAKPDTVGWGLFQGLVADVFAPVGLLATKNESRSESDPLHLTEIHRQGYLERQASLLLTDIDDVGATMRLPGQSQMVDVPGKYECAMRFQFEVVQGAKRLVSLVNQAVPEKKVIATVRYSYGVDNNVVYCKSTEVLNGQGKRIAKHEITSISINGVVDGAELTIDPSVAKRVRDLKTGMDIRMK